jgi:hypothetical protein
LDCPRNAGHPAIQLAVDEIRTAAEKQSDGRDNTEIIARIRPGQFVPTRINEGEDDDADDATVARHSAFPNPQNRNRIPQHLGLVKKDVTEAAADHHSEERDPGDEIAQGRLWEIEIAAPRKHAEEQICEEEGEHIRHPVPAGPDIIPEPEDERIEIVQVIGEHLAVRYSAMLLRAAIDTSLRGSG